jgi:DNA helicase HerA-like ATPase
MTGSGKTGLCLGLLEEAAIDGIPALIIDPKGDLANLLLAFPGLSPAKFAPWVNPDEARNKGVTVDEFAVQKAELSSTRIASASSRAGGVAAGVDAGPADAPLTKASRFEGPSAGSSTKIRGD